ncbi:MAG: hypothetical protein ABJE47_02825 [bacterium]
MTAPLSHRGLPLASGARRRLLQAAALAAVALIPASLLAQSVPNIAAPIRAAEKARAAEDARLSAQTGQALPERKEWRAAGSAPISGPGSAPQQKGASGAQSAAPSAATPANIQPVTREIFSYEAEGRRDPFFSLILTEDLRPLLSDLKLVGILYAATGRGSVAIMRDILTNAQYRVNTGQTIGRMRVAQIKQRAVIFTIDEFGLSRQDSLFLVDSTKVRIR